MKIFDWMMEVAQNGIILYLQTVLAQITWL